MDKWALIENYEGRRYSHEEYLAFENKAIEKHQFFKGVIFDMDLNIVADDFIADVERKQWLMGLR